MKILKLFKRGKTIKLNSVNKLFFSNEDISINVKNATKLSAVYAAIGAISDTISTLPLNLYKKNGRNREIAYEHPLQSVIRYRPNKYMTSTTFIECIVKNILTYGNAYIYPIKTRGGKIKSLEVINADLIELFYYDDEPFYNYLNPKQNIRLEIDELINIPYFTYDGLTGLSPINACKTSLELSSATLNHAKTFYKNGAFPSGVLELPVELSDEAYNRLKKSWHSAYGGENSYKTAILEAGAKYNPITIPNKDAQFIELQQFQIADIARMFNIPAHKIGDLTHATFSNIEQQELNYAVQTIRPLVTKIESFLNRWLLNEDEIGKFYFKFNLSAMLRGDAKSRFESYMLGRNMGVYSVNEIRGLEELNPIEGGDIYDKPLNSNLKTESEKNE